MENEHRLSKGKIITAAVALVVLIALGASWFWVKDKAPAQSEESRGYTELLAVKAEKIKSVTINSQEGKTVIKQESGKISVSPDDEKLSQDILKYFLEGYTTIYATREIKGGFDKIAEYGISQEENYFEIALSDNSKHRFCIGKSISEGYYCLKAEDKTVWLVPNFVGSALMSAPKIETENTDSVAVSIDYENIYYVGVEKAGKAVFKIKRVSDKTAIPYNFYSSYEITEPFTDIAYTTEFTAFMKNLSTVLTPQGHMGLASENSAKYGIDAGYSLTVKDSAKTHILRFGNRSDMGVYMTYNDYPYVYLVSDSILNAVENANPYDFATPYIDLYSVDEVTEVVVKSSKNEYTIKVDNQKARYSLNGADISKESFDKIFGGLSDITSYKGIETDLVKGKKVCDISFKLKDGSEYNRAYYACNSAMVYMTKKESGADATVKKAMLDGVLNLIKETAE